ncbi:CHC2 zinc finger domain-containing protein [Variovorax sp. LARHSF232]
MTPQDEAAGVLVTPATAQQNHDCTDHSTAQKTGTFKPWRTMGFDRSKLPDPVAFYDARGLKLLGRGKWRTTCCEFHGGSDSMRINIDTGAFICMAGCGARGGDVVAYSMAADGYDFKAACRALGAWVEGQPIRPLKPTPLSARAALQAMNPEIMLAAVAAGNVANGVPLTDADQARLLLAAQRFIRIAELFA